MSASQPLDERRMTFLEHLAELRMRVIRAGLALLGGILVSVVFTRRFLEILISPLGDARPQSLRPAENIMVYFKVALILGLVIAMPVILSRCSPSWCPA